MGHRVCHEVRKRMEPALATKHQPPDIEPLHGIVVSCHETQWTREHLCGDTAPPERHRMPGDTLLSACAGQQGICPRFAHSHRLEELLIVPARWF